MFHHLKKTTKSKSIDGGLYFLFLPRVRSDACWSFQHSITLKLTSFTQSSLFDKHKYGWFRINVITRSILFSLETYKFHHTFNIWKHSQIYNAFIKKFEENKDVKKKKVLKTTKMGHKQKEKKITFYRPFTECNWKSSTVWLSQKNKIEFQACFVIPTLLAFFQTL